MVLDHSFLGSVPRPVYVSSVRKTAGAVESVAHTNPVPAATAICGMGGAYAAAIGEALATLLCGGSGSCFQPPLSRFGEV